MKAVSIKKVNGVRSVVINDFANSNIEAEFIKSKKNGMMFYIVENGVMIAHGIQSVCKLLNINNASVLIDKINN